MSEEKFTKETAPIMCAYCSFETPAPSELKTLTDHVLVCEYHPLRKELAAQAEACRVYREALEEIEGSLTDWREGLDYNMEVLRAIARKALEPKGEKI